MNEKQFFWICTGLFFCSASVLFSVIVVAPEQSFVIEPYSTKISCNSSCTFHAQILEVADKNETVFYKLKREVTVDSVFFVGTKKPSFVVGDCVIVSGSIQTFKGKDSIIAQTLRKCDAK